MTDHSHLLNRAIIFTELQGNMKLPAGTKLSVKIGNSNVCDVIAMTPTGQRYEFKSTHIRNLLNTPWVDKVGEDTPAAVVPVEVPAPKAVEPPPNPFTIGDVAPVEEGLANDTLERMDVTGSSALEDHGLLPKSTEEVVVMDAPAVEEKAPKAELAPKAEKAPLPEKAPKAEKAPKGKKG